MDHGWIGRKLIVASPALTSRFVEASAMIGPGAVVLAGISTRFIREVGVAVAAREADPAGAFRRTRGVLRFGEGIDQKALVRAYNGLGAIIVQHLTALPGSDQHMEMQVRGAVRHAARVTVELHRLLSAGQRKPVVESMFGGAAMLAFRAKHPVSAAERAAG